MRMTQSAVAMIFGSDETASGSDNRVHVSNEEGVYK